MKFSMIIATGRVSYGAMLGQPEEHLLGPTLRSLEAQTFRDFELIIVDSCFRFRDIAKEIESLGNWSFPWRVTHPESYWLEQGMWALQNAFNRGFKISTGEFVFFCGDCCEFPPHVLEEAAVFVDRGLSPHLLCVYKHSNRLKLLTGEPSQWASLNEFPVEKWTPPEILCDSRWTYIRARHGASQVDRAHWDLCYGYSGIRRDDFLYVNGYDENFDGDKSLGDVEIGSRLSMAGRWSMYLNRRLYCYEHSHCELDRRAFPIKTGPANEPEKAIHDAASSQIRTVTVRSNYDLIYIMRRLGIWRGNSTRYSEADMKRSIQSEEKNLAGWPKFSFTDDDPSWQYQKHWMEHPSIFELMA